MPAVPAVEGPAREDDPGYRRPRTMPPEVGHPSPDEGPDRRREHHRVVGMGDARHQAEDEDVDREPGPPQEIRCPTAVGARRAVMDDEPGRERHEGERDQPADLAPELGVEHAEEAGASTEPGPGSGGSGSKRAAADARAAGGARGSVAPPPPP